MALEFLEILWGRGLDRGRSSLWISHSFPPPLTCVEGMVRVPFLQLRIGKGSALQEEVDKMLEKSALELVDHLGPGYYSRLCLV